MSYFPQLTDFTSNDLPLPFTGALAGAPVEAISIEADSQHPEAETLDRNPRYRRIPDFVSRFLPGEREITLYLPEAYLTEPARRFPVFYLHDGQNLMDGRTSYVADHTWQIHTTADRLAGAREIEPVILVGIANMGVRRMSEYTPVPDARLGGGQGHLYGRLLVEELKPMIDAACRTLPDPGDTALGGSSLGGLISLALGFQHPQVFGKLAILSPSVWWANREILAEAGHSALPTPDARLWLDMGTGEGLRHLRDCDLLFRRLLQRGWRDGKTLRYLRVPGGLHNEDAWAARFDQVLKFLFPAQK